MELVIGIAGLLFHLLRLYYPRKLIIGKIEYTLEQFVFAFLPPIIDPKGKRPFRPEMIFSVQRPQYLPGDGEPVVG